MSKHILITGGAGFIGSFLTDALIERGDRVRIFDSLEEQVHHGKVPEYLNAKAEFVKGDVRNREQLAAALDGIDTVIHCAAAVGVAQSQYEIKRYTDINVGGLANLLDIIVNDKKPVKQILMPTSMTAYGEGVHICKTHGAIRPGLRPESQLKNNDWQLHCPQCHAVVQPIATPETATRESGTMYALTKNMQEDMLLSFGQYYGIQTTAFRLFNVYGPRQSLSNPYTGVTAIFLSRLKNNQQPVIFEDGKQSRDFISVHDVVNAFLLALDNPKAAGHMFNIGSGNMTTIEDIALTLAKLTQSSLKPKIEAQYRLNDVRHCFADTTKAQSILGWKPAISFDEGMRELVEWSANQQAEDRFEEAEAIRKRKLHSS